MKPDSDKTGLEQEDLRKSQGKGPKMKTGRPPAPTKLKVLNGVKPSRINHAEPVPAERAIEPPPQISAEAREIWDEIAPDRIRQGVLTAWDIEAFAAFCESLVQLRYADWTAAMVLAKPGQESPMSKLRQLVNICTTLGGQFGWTPAARARLSVPGANTHDPEKDLLTG